jgi:hypothetical protein
LDANVDSECCFCVCLMSVSVLGSARSTFGLALGETQRDITSSDSTVALLAQASPPTPNNVAALQVCGAVAQREDSVIGCRRRRRVHTEAKPSASGLGGLTHGLCEQAPLPVGPIQPPRGGAGNSPPGIVLSKTAVTVRMEPCPLFGGQPCGGEASGACMFRYTSTRFSWFS